MTPDTISIITLVISALGLAVAITQVLIDLYPILVEKLNQKLLYEKLNRGSYEESTIIQSTRYYVRPKYSKVDPVQGNEAQLTAIDIREDLFIAVDRFLDEEKPYRHLLLLADSGTGKTSFVLNYYLHNLRRRKSKRHTIALVYLGAKDADDLIDKIPNKEDTVIFLDALDEDSKAIKDYHNRVRQLMEKCGKFRRVVVTCRTQFFSKDEEIPTETGQIKIGPKKAGDKGIYEFEKLYLSPFDDKDIKKFLKLRFPIWLYDYRRKAKEVVKKIPLLCNRPMLLAHIPDLINGKQDIQHSYEFYEEMIDAWLVRESAWVDPKTLREFSERIAVDIYNNSEARGEERVSRSELDLLAKYWDLNLDEWQLSSRSLLNRDAHGNYKFAHRSVLEYLYIIQLISGNVKCLDTFLTDQMIVFLTEIIENESANKTDSIDKIADSKDLISPSAVLVKVLRKIKTIREIPYQEFNAKLKDLDKQILRHFQQLASRVQIPIQFNLPDLLQDVFKSISSELKRVTNISLLELVHVDNKDFLSVVAVMGNSVGFERIGIPLDQKSISSAAIKNNRLYVVNDARIEPNFFTIPEILRGLRSEACIPIQSREGALLGILDCRSVYKKAFSTEDVKFLELVALRLAVIIDLYNILR